MLPQNWRNWVLQNLLKGVDGHTLLSTLLDQGFIFEDCQKALGSNLKLPISVTKNADFYAALAAPGILSQPGDLQLNYVDEHDSQLLSIESFLSPAECQAIIDLAKRKLRPSTITQAEGYADFRTSRTCDLSYLDSPVVKSLHDKIHTTLGLAHGSTEPMQAQHYAVGQEFKAHTDYFEPGSEEYRRFAKERGQRTWTFMIYLNQQCEGGETEFPELNKRFKPVQGRALLWNNLKPSGHPNPRTLHLSHPVQSGEKWVITQWFRDQ